MGRGRRRFDLFSIGMADVELFGAWNGRTEICFSHADTRHFRMVRKSNTQLFDVLTDICGLPYTLSDDVMMDFLYEVIVVDMRLESDMAYVRCTGGDVTVEDAQKLPRAMYDHGFTITGLPENVAGGAESVHYVPFISPASMARKGHYLFVNEKRFGELLRALTLDMLVATERHQPSVAPDVEDKDFISVHKLAAYVGNAYSDGSSVRELRTAWSDAGVESSCGDNRLGLCAANTVCVADMPWFKSGMDRFDYYWGHEDVERASSLPEGAGTLPAWLKAEEQAALERMFLALNDSRDAFLASIPAPNSMVWTAWKRLIGEYFTAANRPKLDLNDALMPVPKKDAAAMPLMLYCVIYAAVLADAGAPSVYYADGAEDVRPWARLEEAVEAFRTGENPRRQLHKKAAETLFQNDRVGGVTCRWQGDGLYVSLGRVPRHYQRARLFMPEPGNDVETQLYDGVGFLSDECFERLESLLDDGSGPLNAVQVRLPWCKGLLVRFSFTRFFADWAVAHGLKVEELQITDVFGTKRRLFDEHGKPCLQAMFTESMFKGTAWFRYLNAEGDKWEIYWQRLEEHDIPLLIAGRDTPPRSSSRLNYQFVSTGGMSAAMLRQMAQDQMTRAKEAMRDPERLIQLLFSGQEEEADEDAPETGETTDSGAEGDGNEGPSGTDDAPDDDGESEAAKDYEACIAGAIRMHGDVLMQTNFLRRKSAGLIRSEAVQLMRGRFPVDGDMRYALPDLLEMCIHLAVTHVVPKRKLPASMKVQRLNAASPEHAHGWYYAPCPDAPWMRKGGRPVAVLRNPHYAPGEEPVLQALPEESFDLYERYFSGLTGCILLPAVTLLTVNGADSDGDRVNVCADGRVLHALQAQAERDNAVWRRMIAERGEAAEFLREEAAAARDPELAEYLRQLAETLLHVLPDALPEGGMGCCAPLLYSGRRERENRKAASTAVKYKASALRGKHLAVRLWEAFSQSGEQTIGTMSLQLLDLASMAYREDEAAVESLGMKELLSCFLPRYLVIQSALDTALEIDMAKSGLRRVDSPVKDMPPAAVKYFGLRSGESNYRIWQQQYKKHRRALNGREPDKAIRSLMSQYRDRQKKPGGSILPLETLPETVYALLKEKQGGKDDLYRLGDALALPVWPEGREAEGEGLSLMLAAQMQQRINAYTKGVTRRSGLEEAHGKLSGKHVLALRWLLGAGFPLQKAHEILDAMRVMLAEWRDKLEDGDYMAALASINAFVMSEERAAEWGWADAKKRKALLQMALTVGTGVELPCPGLLETCMTEHPRGILLLKHVIRYAETEARFHAGETAALTPDGLYAGLRELTADIAEDEALRGEVFFNACRLLSLGSFRRDGEYKPGQGAMNDFLTTYLLKDELCSRIMDKLPEKK